MGFTSKPAFLALHTVRLEVSADTEVIAEVTGVPGDWTAETVQSGVLVVCDAHQTAHRYAQAAASSMSGVVAVGRTAWPADPGRARAALADELKFS